MLRSITPTVKSTHVNTNYMNTRAGAGIRLFDPAVLCGERGREISSERSSCARMRTHEKYKSTKTQIESIAEIN